MRVLVTGGSGFIGSHLVERLAATGHTVMNVDRDRPLVETTCEFAQIDICNREDVLECVGSWGPDVIAHLAAETHVDRSIDGPEAFLTTNILGTFNLLNSVLKLSASDPSDAPRFIHVSTDEVFGSVAGSGTFTEGSPYRPRSPYAASKASADHLVRAWQTTYGLKTVVTNTCNNFGPRQHPEKLIPHMITRALNGWPLPVYGDGSNVRDWIYVSDHAAALQRIIESEATDGTYLIGARAERSNIDIVRTVCRNLDLERPRAEGSYEELITFVADRPGHDKRYAIDPTHMESTFGWTPAVSLEEGLASTVRWYLDHEDWTAQLVADGYSPERIGQGPTP